MGYKSIIEALRPETRFIVVHNESVRPDIESWFTEAGHNSTHVTYVSVAEYVRLTDWAEDAYAALTDTTDGSHYLMEPWSFGRVGDALVADAVEEHTDVRASGSPLIFQGGNCLVGSDFWFLGKDYFADTVALLTGSRPPVSIPPDVSSSSFATKLFTTYLDADRRLILIGTSKPLALREVVGAKEGGTFFLDLPSGGVGTFQPIFHIDMFLTLLGENGNGTFEVLVGSPSLADQLLDTTSPYALAEVFDAIARDLEHAGFAVRRNPLVHWPTRQQTLPFNEIKKLSTHPENSSLVPAVAELEAAGATEASPVVVRDWHHITWNNCLVENSGSFGKHVYLPTFADGDHASLAVIDSYMNALWESSGFTTHLLGNFNAFAERQGVVHCIKKYLSRGA
ncbi:MAG: hypothetical protein ACR2ME_01990 [Acidimicrobiia bacterium]